MVVVNFSAVCHLGVLVLFYFIVFFDKMSESGDGRPSVRPSVTLVDCNHIDWKSRKLITRTISPTSSLFVAKRRSTYSQGNMGKFGGD